jgi:hypothetical protein
MLLFAPSYVCRIYCRVNRILSHFVIANEVKQSGKYETQDCFRLRALTMTPFVNNRLTACFILSAT